MDRTSAAGEYPAQLCRKWAKIVRDALGGDVAYHDNRLHDAFAGHLNGAHIGAASTAYSPPRDYEKEASTLHGLTVFGQHTRVEAAKRRRAMEAELSRMAIRKRPGYMPSYFAEA